MRKASPWIETVVFRFGAGSAAPRKAAAIKQPITQAGKMLRRMGTVLIRRPSKQLVHHLAVHRQAERLRLFARDADGVVDRRGEVGGRRRPVVRVFAAGVAA